jgi:hypothetical protein
MLRRITELEQRADAFGAELYDLAPKQYLERSNTGDSLGVAWRDAVVSAATALNSMKALTEMLTQRVKKVEAKKRDAGVNVSYP